MKTFLCRASKVGLFFVAAFLACQIMPAAAADSASGTFSGQSFGKPASVTFNDVYAFRAEDNKEPVTVVILSESPLDKKAMTATLKKARDRKAIEKYLDKAFIRLKVEEDGKISDYYFYMPPGTNINVSSNKIRSEVKVNTAKRVEGRFSHDDTDSRGELRRIDLRFATDLADIGPPLKI